ncbi:hypothetical protein J14TS2_22080 [Bacillus sp. J14TS2]|nr:hypothetical protein J14TS2_22080 [Bacillus sp. J14TS2]
MKRIRDANLVIIDDLMFMAMDTREANLFFHLINDRYDDPYKLSITKAAIKKQTSQEEDEFGF